MVHSRADQSPLIPLEAAALADLPLDLGRLLCQAFRSLQAMMLSSVPYQPAPPHTLPKAAGSRKCGRVWGKGPLPSSTNWPRPSAPTRVSIHSSRAASPAKLPSAPECPCERLSMAPGQSRLLHRGHRKQRHPHDKAHASGFGERLLSALIERRQFQLSDPVTSRAN